VISVTSTENSNQKTNPSQKRNDQAERNSIADKATRNCASPANVLLRKARGLSISDPILRFRLDSARFEVGILSDLTLCFKNHVSP
jgi:hypothetical protein